MYLPTDYVSKKMMKEYRVELHKRMSGRCFWCNCQTLYTRSIEPGKKAPWHWATIDHVIPLSRGGTNYKSNLVLSCYKCNYDRGNMHEQGNVEVVEHILGPDFEGLSFPRGTYIVCQNKECGYERTVETALSEWDFKSLDIHRCSKCKTDALQKPVGGMFSLVPVLRKANFQHLEFQNVMLIWNKLRAAKKKMELMPVIPGEARSYKWCQTCKVMSINDYIPYGLGRGRLFQPCLCHLTGNDKQSNPYITVFEEGTIDGQDQEPQEEAGSV